MFPDVYAELAQDDLTHDPLLASVPELEGHKVLNACVLHERLGHGGTCVVYRGRHLKLGIDVAVKCLFPERFLAGKVHLKRLGREARIAASISHENLVRVFEFDECHGLNYLVLELVRGPTLRRFVEARGRLTPPEAAHVLVGASRAVAAAHAAGVVHRDLKPENILVAPQGMIKVTDLGLAKAPVSEENLTMPDVALGTPRYMSPEHWKSLDRVGPPGDVWALGATLHFALTGEDAVNGTPAEIMYRVSMEAFPPFPTEPGAPRDLVEIIRTCTRSQPTDRFAHAGELAAALERLPTVAAPGRLEESVDIQVAGWAHTDDNTALSRIRGSLSTPALPPVESRLLVVEDDERVAKALAIRLRSSGYEVILAHDGIQGATLALKHSPALILMDISMPAGDGLTVARHLLELAETRTIPVVFMTAATDPDLRFRAAELGAAAFIQKPFKTEEILATVAALITDPQESSDSRVAQLAAESGSGDSTKSAQP